MNAKRKRKSPTLKAEIFNQLIAEEENYHGVTEDTEKEEEENKSLKLLLNDLEGPLAESDITLNTITDYYHKRLYENDNAIEYLKSKGIINPELHTRFKVGFNDGSIKERLSKKQMTNLHQTFSLREDLNRFYEGCLVFPLFDENEQVINICFLNISDDSEQYLYPDKPGIFNHLASKTYPDQLILTESILDALSLLQIDFNNVQSLMKNPTAFTESHIQHLKDNNVRNAVVAFQSNEFSHEASKILKELLLFNQIDVKMIYPPKPHNSWVTAVNNGFSKDKLVKEIEEASLISHEKKEDDFTVKDDGIHTVFILNGITYRVAGLKEVFVNNLKVKISAEMGDEYFPDTVDLCSSRSRMSYSNILSGRFNVEPRRIENDLIKILRYQEEKRDNALSPERSKVEMTDEEIRLGTEFLKSPSLFEDIVNDMDALGYVGEAVNKKLMYLCATSRLMDDTLNVLVVSQSATGKSYLIEICAKLMPPEFVVDGKTFSKQALQYMGDKLMDKFFVMGEAVHDPDVDYQLRELLSSHKLIRHTVFKDEKTGEMTTKEIKVEAKMSSALTTTDYRINAENASRYFLINTDETADQSKNIVEEHKNIYSEERFYARKESIPQIIRKHQSAQRLLKKYVVIMPLKMRESITYPVFSLRCRRDSKRFFNLIAAVGFFRQYQKEIKQFKNGVSYIECDPYDYEVAYGIMIGGVLSAVFSELTPAVKELYRILRESVRELSEQNNLKFNEVTFTQKQIRTMKNVGQTWLKTNLKILIDYEYVEVVRGGSSRTKGFYHLKDDEELESLDLKKALPSPEAIKKAMKGED